MHSADHPSPHLLSSPPIITTHRTPNGPHRMALTERPHRPPPTSTPHWLRHRLQPLRHKISLEEEFHHPRAVRMEYDYRGRRSSGSYGDGLATGCLSTRASANPPTASLTLSLRRHGSCPTTTTVRRRRDGALLFLVPLGPVLFVRDNMLLFLVDDITSDTDLSARIFFYSILPMEKVEALEDMVSLAPSGLVKNINYSAKLREYFEREIPRPTRPVGRPFGLPLAAAAAEQRLQALRQKLGRKQHFEVTVADLAATVHGHYAGASPALRDLVRTKEGDLTSSRTELSSL
ncbi:hypothetical protein GUJ93_ZPchr0001g31781 [Zizania palustris]|uniref:Uncharacterized protein n=1 Tax=Zizania palustris TaxID=103762 RepID=A0A8J5UZT6_ZIZPA|nr:hypothetical protein GUJ93_ZPchr0001g31781 [Zizania palustris]